jgi:hypothetical protein
MVGHADLCMSIHHHALAIIVGVVVGGRGERALGAFVKSGIFFLQIYAIFIVMLLFQGATKLSSNFP